MSLESLKKLLPKNVDAELVLTQLPADIQKCVLADYGIMVETTSAGKCFTPMSHDVVTRARTSISIICFACVTTSKCGCFSDFCYRFLSLVVVTFCIFLQVVCID